MMPTTPFCAAKRSSHLGAVARLLRSASLFIATAAVAAVAFSAEESNTLESSELTPLGAERAGNASGTVPPWTGGITEPPPNYQPGDRHPDPFADDTPLFSITAANMDEHANHLKIGRAHV